MRNPTIGNHVTWTDRSGERHGRVVGFEDWNSSRHGSGPLRRLLHVQVDDDRIHSVWADLVTACQPDPVEVAVHELAERFGYLGVKRAVDLLGARPDRMPGLQPPVRPAPGPDTCRMATRRPG